jgi:probable phosphomutase (TIGR03848 family)
VTTLLLVRHGRTTANATGVLAGWSPGVDLDEAGRAQAAALAERLASLSLAAVVSSPLERCRQTLDILLEARPVGRRPETEVEDRFGECRYGDWTGQELRKLAKEPLWKVVQAHPSAATFPGPDGESMSAMSARAVAAVRFWNDEVARRAGAEATYLVCSHGDVIKAIVADALGMHLDSFQRIAVDPCSVTAIRYTPLRPFVLRMNDVGGVAGLASAKGHRRRVSARASDAVVGGGAGSHRAAGL